MRFKGKSVVVLGGNSGIGLAAAKAFQAEGATVAITGRNQNTLDAVSAETGMLAVQSDVSDVADTKRALAKIAAQNGGIDILFANASGPPWPGCFVDKSPELLQLYRHNPGRRTGVYYKCRSQRCLVQPCN